MLRDDEKLGWLLGGAVAGLGVGAWLASDRRKSRAERDDPDLVQEVLEELQDLLDVLFFEGVHDSERDYHSSLVDYLEAHSQHEIESEPSVDGLRPDILIADAVALELKVNPGKAERERCVGQVSGYYEEWMTVVIAVDTKPSRARNLKEALQLAGLDDLPVIFVA